MIPVLYAPKTTDFNNNGLGLLKDAISCKVEEERNGTFELSMTYPADGQHFKDIAYAGIILAKPSETGEPQPFRIYSISEPLGGQVEIRAEHISYMLLDIPVLPFTGATSASAALNAIKNNSIVANPFTFSTDVTTQATMNLKKPASARLALGGMEGSALDNFGGEYEWDGFNVRLHAARGADNGVVLRYGKNITDLKQETSIADTVTGILPYWANDSVTVVGDLIYASNHASFPNEKITIEDVSSEIEAEGEEVPTKADVNAAGRKILNGKSYIGVPSINISVSFQPLWQTAEYKDIAPLETVGLCDTVTVIFEKLGIEEKAKVVKTIYDVLLERYESIEIGDIKKTFSKAVAEQAVEIAQLQEENQNQDKKVWAKFDVMEDSIQSEVADLRDADNQMMSQIDQQADEIELRVLRNSVISSINLSPEQITIDTNRLNIVGYVTFNNLQTAGQTSINGANILTGTLSADKISGGEIKGLSFYTSSAQSFTDGNLHIENAKATVEYQYKVYVKYYSTSARAYVDGLLMTLGSLYDGGAYLDVNRLYEGDQRVVTWDGMQDWVGNNYAPTNHSHSGYALTNHTHSGYASVNHSHSEYALTSHTHSGYASSSHTHDKITNGSVNFTIGSGGHCHPSGNGTVNCGTSSNKFKAVYADNGTIQTSDKKEKDHMTTLDDVYDDVLAFVMRVEPVEFTYKKSEHKRPHFGFYAQDLQQAAYDTVGDFSAYQAAYIDPKTGEEIRYDDDMDNDDENLRWTMAYAEMIPPLYAVVKKQQEQITRLEKLVEQLQEEKSL